MAITFNIDLSRRRKEQQALAKLEAQRQQAESLRQSAFGIQSEGPPTRFGEVPVEGGQLAPNPFVEQLFGNQATAGEGIKQTLALLEQQRKNETAQNQQAQIQNAIQGLPTNTPESKALSDLFLATGGENRDIAKALGQQFAPFSLGQGSSRFTGSGDKIVSASQATPRGAGIKAFAPVVLVNQSTKEKMLVSPTFDPMTGQAQFSQFDFPQGFQISKETPVERRFADAFTKVNTGRVMGEIKNDQTRFKELRSTTASRRSSIGKADKFLALFKNRSFSSGAGRSALKYVPGVYTDQGKLDEEFNAFAEIAARQALKASGEIRPTDADVEGMKRAMFGIGRDESVNIQLLQDYLDQQKFNENEFISLGGLPPLSSGGTDLPPPGGQ